MADHDEIAARYCRATELHSSERRCICPDPSDLAGGIRTLHRT